MTWAKAIDWSRVKAVIFDVDGTLYEQKKLRRRVLFDLLTYYIVRPWRLSELRILQSFRAEREHRAGTLSPDLEAEQYTWTATQNTTPGKIRRVVEHWMLHHPNQYLARAMYPGTAFLFAALRGRGIRIGIYSDYPAAAKVAALGLEADIIVNSTDAAVSALKPAPHGLFYIANELGLSPRQCLFIGDRQELDGLCAERAGMPCLILPSPALKDFTFYAELARHLSTVLKQKIAS